MTSLIADRGEFWWNDRKPDEPVLWDSKIELGEKFFRTPDSLRSTGRVTALHTSFAPALSG